MLYLNGTGEAVFAGPSRGDGVILVDGSVHQTFTIPFGAFTGISSSGRAPSRSPIRSGGRITQVELNGRLA